MALARPVLCLPARCRVASFHTAQICLTPPTSYDVEEVTLSQSLDPIAFPHDRHLPETEQQSADTVEPPHLLKRVRTPDRALINGLKPAKEDVTVLKQYISPVRTPIISKKIAMDPAPFSHFSVKKHTLRTEYPVRRTSSPARFQFLKTSDLKEPADIQPAKPEQKVKIPYSRKTPTGALVLARRHPDAALVRRHVAAGGKLLFAQNKAEPRRPSPDGRVFSFSPRSYSTQQQHAASPQPDAMPQPTPDITALPYFVERSASGNLPVYSDYKGHGTLTQTVIRKIAGDSKKLKEDLVQHLTLDPKNAKVTQPANHVVLKGDHNQQVMEFLKGRGF